MGERQRMITIIKPGLLSSIQDLGRYGYQKYGVITSGAMDPLAHRLANLLVGNKENKPTIEITLLGPVIQFEQNHSFPFVEEIFLLQLTELPFAPGERFLLKKDPNFDLAKLVLAAELIYL